MDQLIIYSGVVNKKHCKFAFNFLVSNSTTVFGTDKVSTASEISVVIAMAAFLLFANILLMNLLIADFRFALI